MLNRRKRNRMSASFAKAVMPRVRREGDIKREPDWTLGWVFPIKTDLPSAAESDGAGAPARGLTNEVTSSSVTTDEIFIKTVHD